MSALAALAAVLAANKAVAAFIAALLALARAWWKGRRDGIRRERQRQAAASLRNRRTRDAIDDAIAGRTDDDIRKGLDRWSR